MESLSSSCTGSRRGNAKSWYGTSRRSVSPHQTLARYERFAPALGITRLANLTGLDYLGIPVFAAIRPNARSLSVHQGKGLDEASARASAFMEAAEFDHAERVEGRRLTFAYGSPPNGATVADPELLPRVAGRRFRPDLPMEWIEGRDLIAGGPIFVPLALVAIDFTQAAGRSHSCFIESTTGLASGNTIAEAIASGLFEVIERDATCLWRLRSARDRAARRLDPATVTSGKCAALLKRLKDTAIAAAVWDTSTDIGIASFLCRIREDTHNTRSSFGAFWGAGCHLSREVAFCRAVTEAVQTRLTYISGSRDDLLRHDYAEAPHGALFDRIFDLWERREGNRSFGDVPNRTATSIEGDLEGALAGLKSVGIEHAIAVDLTRGQIGMPVVRVIVPGLEPDDHRLGHRFGPRAHAVVAGTR